MNKRELVILGSGNVATHLSQGLIKAGHRVLQVYSRRLDHAKELAKKISAMPVDNLDQITSAADGYLVCVSDKAIVEVVDSLTFTPRWIAHTSGSISMQVLEKFPNHGVFYPLQTFSKKREVNLSETPFCIEANNESTSKLLDELAHSLSGFVTSLNSEERKQCHLAAVFANNFVNHFYTLAETILKEKNLDFMLLKPLVLETAQKVLDMSPEEAQTGPAARNDQNVIEEHLRLLASPKLENLYRFVSESITEHALRKTNVKDE